MKATDKLKKAPQLLPCPFCGDEGEKGIQAVTLMNAERTSFNRVTCRCCGATCPEPNWNLRAALAQQDAQAVPQEPVAWLDRNGFPHHISHLQPLRDMKNGKWLPLYAASTPPAKQPLGPVMHKPSGFTFDSVIAATSHEDLMPLTPPAQRVELTDEEIDELARTMVKGNS